MTEDFLHYIWKYRLYKNPLATTAGDRLCVIKPGEHNRDSGPDFFNARIRLNSTLWAGNIEIHVRASDWSRHGHDLDPGYDNIILHVVYYADAHISRSSGDIVPCLLLRPFIDGGTISKFSLLMQNRHLISCYGLIRYVSGTTSALWVEALAIARMEAKVKELKRTMGVLNNNLEETLYAHLARNFGFKLNAVPFELLARSLPLKVLLKHKDHLCQLESLLYGQAGLLEGNPIDGYTMRLKQEYEFLRHKYYLKPLKGHLWKFLRLRPSNFPTIRISQFANLIHKYGNIFSKLPDLQSPDQVAGLFEIPASVYWDRHYVFGKSSAFHVKNMGVGSARIIVINSVVPFLLLSGELRGRESLKERALDFLYELGPEDNAVTRIFSHLGISPGSAFESQGLLQLHNHYCRYKRCLDCRIGHELLKSANAQVKV